MLLMAGERPAGWRHGPDGGTAIHRRQDEGAREARRLRAALLEPRRRHAVAGDPGARHRDALPHVAVGRPRLERHRPRSRPARRRHVVRFQRIGKKVLLVEPNYALPRHQRQPGRAARRRRGVRDARCCGASRSAPRPTAASSSTRRRSCCATCTTSSRSLEPASYSLDASRSAVNLERTKAFPRNTELDVLLTFTGNGERRRRDRRRPARRARHRRRADGDRRHRAAAPLVRAAAGPGLRAAALRSARRRLRRRRTADFAAPMTAPLVTRFTVRHRLRKQDPAAAVSDAGPADRLLPRSRHAGADPLGAARRRALVERRPSRRPATATPSASS